MNKEKEILAIYDIITKYLISLHAHLNDFKQSDSINIPISFYTYFNKEILTSNKSILNEYNNSIVYFAKKSNFYTVFIHGTLIKKFDYDSIYMKLKTYYETITKKDNVFLDIINSKLPNIKTLISREEFIADLDKNFKKYLFDKELEIEINKFLFCIIWENFYSINSSFYAQIREVGIGSFKKQPLIENKNIVSTGFRFLTEHVNKIDKIHNFLVQNNFLTSNTRFLFKIIFKEGFYNEKLCWNGKISTLYYFIYMLHYEKYLVDTSNEKWKKTALVFTISNKNIDFKKLRRLKKSKECDSLDHIFEILKIDG